jgi:RNA-directed DNA polymerase
MERGGPAVCSVSLNREGRDEMIKASIDLQDLRRRLYVKAKAETTWRFWGLYVHVCKMETLRQAYALAKENDGAPGVDGVTFEAIESQGADAFLEQIRDELVQSTYKPLPARRQEIPKDGGKVRLLSIPAIRDRVVQGALKLILEPIFEADFQPGSFGYRPKKTAHEAVDRVAQAIVHHKTRVIDFDLRSYFDNVRHDRLLTKVAKRVDDDDVMHLLKIMLKANGRCGVPQGGVVSPLLSNIYLNEVDRMLERAKEATRYGEYTGIEYARFADDLVILIDAHPRHDWLLPAVEKRLREELAALQVEVNEEKSRIVDLGRSESFGFLGFDFRRIRSGRGVWRAQFTPKLKKRTALLWKLKEIFRRHRSQPVNRVIELINPILRGWVNYFTVGHSSECFRFVQNWVEKKVRRHMMKARKRQGFGWTRWSRQWLYDTLKLFNGYKVKWLQPKVAPAG